MTTVDIHGQQVPIPEIPEGNTALDVIILVRAVEAQENGELGDAIHSSTSPGATFTTVIGTVQRHLWELEEVARGPVTWDEED